MKKTGKVLVILALVLVLLAGMAVTAFAAPGDEKDEKKQGDGKSLARLFLLYDPDSLDDYLAFREEHKAFHEGRQAQREQAKQDIRDGLNAIIDAVLAGEMTVDEARDAIEAARANMDAARGELSAIGEAKKAENESIRSQIESARAQIKTELEAETVDEAQVASLLGQIMALHDQHLAADYKYAAQFDAVIAQYLPAQA